MNADDLRAAISDNAWRGACAAALALIDNRPHDAVTILGDARPRHPALERIYLADALVSVCHTVAFLTRDDAPAQARAIVQQFLLDAAD